MVSFKLSKLKFKAFFLPLFDFLNNSTWKRFNENSGRVENAKIEALCTEFKLLLQKLLT
jgi:hypothetical protein